MKNVFYVNAYILQPLRDESAFIVPNAQGEKADYSAFFLAFACSFAIRSLTFSWYSAPALSIS